MGRADALSSRGEPRGAVVAVSLWGLGPTDAPAAWSGATLLRLSNPRAAARYKEDVGGKEVLWEGSYSAGEEEVARTRAFYLRTRFQWYFVFLTAVLVVPQAIRSWNGKETNWWLTGPAAALTLAYGLWDWRLTRRKGRDLQSIVHKRWFERRGLGRADFEDGKRRFGAGLVRWRQFAGFRRINGGLVFYGARLPFAGTEDPVEAECFKDGAHLAQALDVLRKLGVRELPPL